MAGLPCYTQQLSPEQFGSGGESNMAVQQNKKSPSKRGMHRSHNALAAPGTAIEPTTGVVHLRHHVSPPGFYGGRKVVKIKADAWLGLEPDERRRPGRRLIPP